LVFTFKLVQVNDEARLKSCLVATSSFSSLFS
jgi:hypothetical protein